MITFQILDPVVNHLDLLLDNRHTLCEVVVFSDLSGQLVHLRLHDSLCLIVGDQNSDKGNTTGDKGSDDGSLHIYTPSKLLMVFFPATPSTSSPIASWYLSTAFLVAGPKEASAPLSPQE